MGVLPMCSTGRPVNHAAARASAALKTSTVQCESVQCTNAHWGGTPLHAAAHANQKAVAALLIARGADVGCRSGNGRTPLAETAFHKATAVARLLKEHGAA